MRDDEPFLIVNECDASPDLSSVGRRKHIAANGSCARRYDAAEASTVFY